MDTLIERHIEEGRKMLNRLLSAEPLPMSEVTPSSLPGLPGLYVFSLASDPNDQFVRAGRAAGAGGLRQRIYQNHLMGNQSGNLRSQLVQAGDAADLEDAKTWIRDNLVVRCLPIDDPASLPWAEHFILSVLRPRFSD